MSPNTFRENKFLNDYNYYKLLAEMRITLLYVFCLKIASFKFRIFLNLFEKISSL